MARMRPDPLFPELGGGTSGLNRMFGRDDLLEADGISGAGDWAPAVDILETDGGITIKAELPGVEGRDVHISLDSSILTLRGERRSDHEFNNENYHRMERAYGSFCRCFTLPAFVDDNNITAEFRNGLLTITLPKKDSAKGRTIEVNAA